MIAVLVALIIALLKTFIGLLVLALGAISLFVLIVACAWVFSLLWMARTSWVELLENYRYTGWYSFLDIGLFILISLISFGTIFYFLGDAIISLCGR